MLSAAFPAQEPHTQYMAKNTILCTSISGNGEGWKVISFIHLGNNIIAQI